MQVILLNGRHRKALELLHSGKCRKDESVENTINYLHKLGAENIELILEFSEWVLKHEPERGLMVIAAFLYIFFANENAFRYLPRIFPKWKTCRGPAILDTLLKKYPEVTIPYLEHVIHIWKDVNPFFHNALVHQYKEKILKDGLANSEHTRRKLITFLENVIF